MFRVLGFRVSGFGFRFRVLVFGCRVSGFWFRVSGIPGDEDGVPERTNVQISGLLSRVLVVRFGISGFRLRVSGFGFRVGYRGFRFQILGIPGDEDRVPERIIVHALVVHDRREHVVRLRE